MNKNHRDVVSRQELVAKIQESLQPMEWKVLQLHYLEGMSGKEVARRRWACRGTVVAAPGA